MCSLTGWVDEEMDVVAGYSLAVSYIRELIPEDRTERFSLRAASSGNIW